MEMIDKSLRKHNHRRPKQQIPSFYDEGIKSVLLSLVLCLLFVRHGPYLV